MCGSVKADQLIDRKIAGVDGYTRQTRYLANVTARHPGCLDVQLDISGARPYAPGFQQYLDPLRV